MLPTKTLASREQKSVSGYKQSKEGLMVLAWSNKSHKHKLRLILLGKSKRPRPFKNVNIQNHSVNQVCQPKKHVDRFTSIYKMAL